MAGNNRWNPSRSGGQADGSFPSIKKDSTPLDTRESNYQGETKQRKAYTMVSQKMSPILTLETTGSEKNNATVGSFPSTSKANFNPTYDEMNDKDVNLRTQFIKTGQVDSSSFKGQR